MLQKIIKGCNNLCTSKIWHLCRTHTLNMVNPWIVLILGPKISCTIQIIALYDFISRSQDKSAAYKYALFEGWIKKSFAWYQGLHYSRKHFWRIWGKIRVNHPLPSTVKYSIEEGVRDTRFASFFLPPFLLKKRVKHIYMFFDLAATLTSFVFFHAYDNFSNMFVAEKK